MKNTFLPGSASRRRTSTSLLIALLPFLLAAAAPPATPTPDQILDRYIEAAGGKAALEKLQTRVMKGTLESSLGITGAVEVRAKAPNRSVSKIELQTFGAIREGYDGTVAWSVAPFQGVRVKEGADLARVQRNAWFPRELRLRQVYGAFKVLGSAKVGTSDTWVLEAAPKVGKADKLYFDKKSGLLVREETTVEGPLGAITFQNELGDYRDVDGVMVPFSMRLPNPPELGLKVSFFEVKHGEPLADDEFAKPAR